MRNLNLQSIALGLAMSCLVAAPNAGASDDAATAIFAGGCFWCSEADFEKLDGVQDVVSGYTGGDSENPSYREVSSGSSGHVEAVLVSYDPSKISYAQLVEYFWTTVDPTQPNAQFCDHGPQYRTVIYYAGDEERDVLFDSKENLDQNKPFDAPIVTELTPRQTFWPAEDYHQDYYKRNAYRYKFYRFSCGRDARLKELWGDNAMRIPG